MVKELPKNQLRPAAQPVSRFLNYGAQDPAAPTKPSMAPAPKGINIVQRSNEMSIKGYNSFTEWSNSMKQVSGAIATAAPVIKSAQEQRGKNDVMKALMLHSRQNVQNGIEYAQENRKVSNEDWIAGLNMDQVNPWRRAGMEEQLSKLAGGEAETYVKRAYNAAASELVGLDPADPRLDQVRGNAIAQLTKDFGINEASNGFADHALPKINSAWAKSLDKQFEAHTKYQKAQQKVLTKRELMQSMKFYYGVDIDPESLQLTLGGILNYQANKLGLAGEPTEFKEEVLLDLHGQLQLAALNGDDKAEGMLEMLGQIPVDMRTDDKGNVVGMITADEMFGADFFIEKDKFGKAVKSERDREAKRVEATFTNTYAEKLIRAKKNSPEYKQLKEEAFNDPKFDGLPFLKKVELIEDLDEKDTEFARLQHSSTIENVDAFFAKYRSRHGILYDENEANQELNKILSNFPPELSEYVADQWSNFQTMSNTKRVTGKANLSQINTLAGRLADNAVKSRYPEIGKKLLRGDDGNLDLGKYLGTRSEAIRTGDIELRQILTDAAIDALQDVADEGGSLDVKDQGKIISDAMNLVIKDKERMNGVLPAIAEKKEEKENEGKKVETPPTFKLDTFIPGERLKEGAYLNAPVFDAPTTEKLIEEIRTGKRLPVPVINAALRAGVSPQQFILDTAGFYKDEDWYPSDMERIRLLKEGNDEKGFGDSLQSRSPLSSPFATATNHLAIVLTGIVPPRFS